MYIGVIESWPIFRIARAVGTSGADRRRNAMNADAPWLVANSTRPARCAKTNQR
jgi:hypothetical protein